MNGVPFEKVNKMMAEHEEALKLLRKYHQLYTQGLTIMNQKKQEEILQLHRNHAAMLAKKSEKIGKLEDNVYRLENQVEELVAIKTELSTLRKLSYAASTIGVSLLVASAAASFTGIGVAIAPLLLIAGAVLTAVGLALNVVDSVRKTSTVFREAQKAADLSRTLEA